MATIHKTVGGSYGHIRDRFRTNIDTFDAGLPPAVSQALRSLSAALDYEDRPLIRSHLETAFAAMTEALGELIEKRLEWSRSIRTHFRTLAAEVGGSPSREFDDVGRYVTDQLATVVRVLADLRDNPVRAMNDARLQVPGESGLQAEIAEMETFRNSIVGGWPWSHLPLPASDSAMLARSRKETLGGHGVSIEDLIHEIESAV